MTRFVFAAFSPYILILIALFGPPQVAWGGLLCVTVFAVLMDQLLPASSDEDTSEFPAALPLLYVLTVAHFALLGAWLYGGFGFPALTDIVILITSGLIMGQIAHPVAHEMIHKSGRLPRFLGRLIYSTMLIGHHASAHMRVHHIYVASAKDPNSARKGLGFYRYFIRAIVGSFVEGLIAENQLRENANRNLLSHPYLLYIGVALGMLVLIGLARPDMLLPYIMLCILAQSQIYLSDYVQHYGLKRGRLTDGKLEQVGPQHSWNAPHPYSAAMILNASRHSDHHVRPSIAYTNLRLDDEIPTLPYSMPVMAVIALIPPLWRNLMDPLCDLWKPNWEENVRNAKLKAANRNAKTVSEIANRWPSMANR